MTGSALAELARLAGVETVFRDARGQIHRTPPDVLQAILGAMGLAAGSPAEVRETLAAQRARAAGRLVPDWIVARNGAGTLEPARSGRWAIANDDGEAREGKGTVDLAALPIGVHRLTIEAAGECQRATIIVPPERAPGVAELAGRSRIWGIAAPLYGLRSAGNIGLGTYTDLGEAAETVASLGADYLAINPVHALFPTEPGLFSPYSPSHRRFLNVFHIDAAAIPEFDFCEDAQTLLATRRAGIATLRASELADYRGVWTILAPVLEALFAAFERRPAQREAFEAWCAASGAELARFATYQVLAERHGPFWSEWPAALRDPNSPDVAEIAAADGRRGRFHRWLQWTAATQLDGAAYRARRAGMALGLVSDLAVGVRPDGAESWAEPGDFARGVSLGAPPDAFNPTGQDWQLAPFRPAALIDGGFRAIADTLARSLAWAGALRIDHIVGFARSYWIPDGSKVGAYVRYPTDALIALAAIAGDRHRALIIGEDLGNVPSGLRDAMDDAGLHGCRLTMFERDRRGRFHQPGAYAPRTMAAFGSHDLPDLCTWWRGEDIDLRAGLGLIDRENAEDERAARSVDRGALADAFDQAGASADGDISLAPPVLAAHRFLAATDSALATVQAENLFEGTGQLNVPGTIDEYPNWRRRLPDTSEWSGRTRVREIAGAMERVRGTDPGDPPQTTG